MDAQTENSKEKLASEGRDITLNKCLDILRQHESVKSTMQRIGGDGREEASLNAAYRSRDPTRQSQKNGGKQRQQHSQQKKKCTWCGGERHKREDCPAKDASCDFCNKKGHFQRACKIKKMAPLHVKSDEDDSDESSQYDMDAVTINKVKTKAREVFCPCRIPRTKYN